MIDTATQAKAVLATLPLRSLRTLDLAAVATPFWNIHFTRIYDPHNTDHLRQYIAFHQTWIVALDDAIEGEIDRQQQTLEDIRGTAELVLREIVANRQVVEATEYGVEFRGIPEYDALFDEYEPMPFYLDLCICLKDIYDAWHAVYVELPAEPLDLKKVFCTKGERRARVTGVVYYSVKNGWSYEVAHRAEADAQSVQDVHRNFFESRDVAVEAMRPDYEKIARKFGFEPYPAPTVVAEEVTA